MSIMLFAFLCVFLGLVAQNEARQCVCGTTLSGSGVNIRDCGSTSCAVVGAMADGECADYLDQSSGVWHYIDLKGTVGWVHGDYVSGPQFCGGHGDYCTATMCSSWLGVGNDMRTCDPQGCGHYGASRGSRTHGGTDIKCTMNDEAYVPFEGLLVRKAYPYGDGSCCDTGYLLEGTGIWAGYEVMVFYTEPDANLIGTHVTKGSRIGYHTGLHCGCYSSSMTDHAHFQYYHHGQIIDGSSFVLCH